MVAIVMCGCGLANASAATLSVPELVSNIQRAHPYIAAMEEQGVQRQLALTTQESAFDPSIEQATSARVRGYYNGVYASQRYIQPLASMNAKVYSEYRLADGDFPVYEQQYATLSGGEARLGVALSLLRDRTIDKRRTGVANAKLAIAQWQSEFADTMNQTVFEGVTHYLYWLATALQIDSVTALIDTATSRKQALALRVEQGDLAQSDLIEFEANLLQQQLLLAELNQTLAASQLELGFYLRDQNGSMAQTDKLQASLEHLDWPYSVSVGTVMELRQQLTVHPALQQIQQDIRMLENKQMLADNALLPTLDVSAAVARDIGSGPASLDGAEAKLGLRFSFPLGNRAAKAEVATLKSKYNEFIYKRQLLSDRIRQTFDKAYRRWQQATQLAQLQQQNTELAERLYDMEVTRFNAGDSDMFVLNARESARIKAQMTRIKAVIDVYLAELALHYAAADLTP